MPKILAERLEEIGRALFVAAGTPPEEADIVMRHVVGANLVGHDSHGVIQIPTYIERIKVGHIVPGAPWMIVKELPTTTVVDGHWGFGYVANERAMRLTIEKAKTTNRRGRDGVSPGAYRAGVELHADGGAGRHDRHRSPPIPAARQKRWRRLAAARRGSAPTRSRSRCRPISRGRSISTWRPRRRPPARSRSQSRATSRCPTAGSSAATASRPTTRASCARAARFCRWAARDGGYKGSGLAVMVEILCGLLTGLGFGVEPTGRHNDGCFMAVFKVDAFRPLAEFKKEVGDFVRYLKETPPAEGSSGVLYPGEIEHMREAGPARQRHRGRGRHLVQDCAASPKVTALPSSSALPR